MREPFDMDDDVRPEHPPSAPTPAQLALARAAEVSAEADAVLAASYARRVPDVDPLANPGWEPTRPPETEPVRRSVQRRAPTARRSKPPVTRASLERWADMMMRTVGLAVRKQLDIRDAENRELATLVRQLAERVDQLERERGRHGA